MASAGGARRYGEGRLMKLLFACLARVGALRHAITAFGGGALTARQPDQGFLQGLPGFLDAELTLRLVRPCRPVNPGAA